MVFVYLSSYSDGLEAASAALRSGKNAAVLAFLAAGFAKKTVCEARSAGRICSEIKSFGRHNVRFSRSNRHVLGRRLRTL